MNSSVVTSESPRWAARGDESDAGDGLHGAPFLKVTTSVSTVRKRLSVWRLSSACRERVLLLACCAMRSSAVAATICTRALSTRSQSATAERAMIPVDVQVRRGVGIDSVAHDQAVDARGHFFRHRCATGRCRHREAPQRVRARAQLCLAPRSSGASACDRRWHRCETPAAGRCWQLPGASSPVACVKHAGRPPGRPMSPGTSPTPCSSRSAPRRPARSCCPAADAASCGAASVTAIDATRPIATVSAGTRTEITSLLAGERVDRRCRSHAVPIAVGQRRVVGRAGHR